MQETISAEIWQIDPNRRRVCVITCPGKTREISRALAETVRAGLSASLPKTCQVRSLCFGFSEQGQRYVHQIWVEVGEDPEDDVRRALEDCLKLDLY